MLTIISDQELQDPDSLLPLHICFLAYTSVFSDHEKAVSHTANNEEDENEKRLLDRSKQIVRRLWKDNGKDYDEESEAEDESVKNLEEKMEQIIQEM